MLRATGHARMVNLHAPSHSTKRSSDLILPDVVWPLLSLHNPVARAATGLCRLNKSGPCCREAAAPRVKMGRNVKQILFIISCFRIFSNFRFRSAGSYSPNQVLTHAGAREKPLVRTRFVGQRFCRFTTEPTAIASRASHLLLIV